MTEAATFASSFPEKCSQSDVSVERINVAPEKWLLARRHHLGLGFPAKFQQILTAWQRNLFSAWEAHATSRSRYVGTPSAWKASWLRGFGRKVLQRADSADFGVAVFAASRELSKAGIQATKMELACHTCAENCEYFDVI